MPSLRVPALLKYYLDNQTEVALAGATVAEVLADVCRRYPKIRSHLFDDQGAVRRHVNLFVNQDNIRDLNGMETALKENDVVKVLPSVTGG